MTFAPDLAIHAVSRQLLEHYVLVPRHGLLLHGQKGVGLTTIAHAVAASINAEAKVYTLAPEGTTDITIEQIRSLYDITKTTDPAGRIIIVDMADRMSMPAQNAFLKLLEEPPAATYFILVSHDMAKLLDTIRSRVNAIEVRPLEQHRSSELIASLTTDMTKRAQLLFMANGRPAYIKRLSSDEELFEHEAATARDARKFIESPVYDRLVLLTPYVTDRQRALEFLDMLSHIIYFMSKKQSVVSTTALAAVTDAIDNLHENTNVRLELLYLATAL